MKSHYTKWAIIGLAVVVAAASIGVSYAKSSGKGHHSGDTVPTIYFNDPFSWVVSNDDGVIDTVPPYGLIDPGDDGGGTEYDYWGPSSSNDPSAPPPAMGQPCPRYDKDVASTDATLTDPHTIDVTVNNAYPCYYSSIFFAVENAGLVPITVQSIEVDENASTPDVLDDIDELTVTASGINLGQVIEPGTEEVGRLSVHVEQSAQQLATYTIRVKIVTVAPECAECDGKVTQLTLQYNGSQGATIRVEQKKEGTVFEDWVAAGAQFTFNGKDDKGTLGTEISIYVNGVLNTTIHTSCSVPIGPGLVSGDFEVIEGYSRNGGLLCPLPPVGGGSGINECAECDGKVTQLTLQYNGSQGATIRVEQKKEGTVFEDWVAAGAQFTFNGKDDKGTLGTEISIYVNGVLNTTIHTSCSVPIGPGLVSGDFEVIEGYSKDGGLLCPLPPVGGGSGSNECAECKGKVTQLTLQYTGSQGATIKVEQKDGVIVFEDWVAAGATFTFNGKDRKGTLGTEISIYVNGVLNTTIHTSCSVPIGPGLVSGDFEVIEGYSKDGGLLCPLPP